MTEQIDAGGGNTKQQQNVKSSARNQLVCDLRILFITLVVAGTIGAFWIGLIAAWDHHDEPSHFQYVRRLVDDGRVPVPGTENWKLNRQIFKSMIWNGFFERMNLIPILPAPKEPVYFPGYSQYNEPPAYYYLASLVVKLFLNENITRQMFSARLVSLVFFLLTIFAAWGTARELSPFGHPLRWMLPISLAFYPPLIDIMTAVNNDSGSIAVVSFFIWICVRLIQKGLTIKDLLLGAGLSVLAWYMKSTAALVIPLFPIAILFAIFHGRTRVIAWSLIIVLLLLGLGFMFQTGDAAYYYRSTAMEEPTRTRNSQAVHGDWILQVNESNGTTPVWMPALFQPIPFDKTIPVSGQKITLGFWMWADQDIEARTPALATENGTWYQTVQLTQIPTFYTVEGAIDEKARLWLSIDPFQGDQGFKIYLDGMVLADGERPLDSPPVFIDEKALQGTWGGRPFENMLRNGSAEQASIRIRGFLDDIVARYYPDQIRPSFVLMSLMDKNGAGWYYNLVLKNIFDTFTGYFGWDHIRLNPPFLITAIQVFMIVGFVGALIGLGIRRKRINWAVVFFLFLAVSVAVLSTIPRGIVFLAFPRIYVPVGRYFMPVIIPIFIAVNLGWYWLWRVIKKKITNEETQTVYDGCPYSTLGFVIYGAAAFLVNLIAIISVWNYYGGYHLFM